MWGKGAEVVDSSDNSERGTALRVFVCWRGYNGGSSSMSTSVNVSCKEAKSLSWVKNRWGMLVFTGDVPIPARDV